MDEYTEPTDEPIEEIEVTTIEEMQALLEEMGYEGDELEEVLRFYRPHFEGPVNDVIVNDESFTPAPFDWAAYEAEGEAYVQRRREEQQQ